MPWEPGATIVLQEVWHGRLYAARPVIVAEDAGDRLALWCPRGTRWKAPTTPPTRERAPTRAERIAGVLAHEDWVFLDVDWPVTNLILVRPGDWHAVWVGWDEAGNDWGWYVNFQRPYARTAHAIQTLDLALDIVIDADGRWRWKDEDEFEVLLNAGLIRGQEEDAVRREAASVIARLEANEPPFGEPWHAWRPDPMWPAPSLPPDWERLHQ